MELFIQIKGDVVITQARGEIKGREGDILHFLRKGESLTFNGTTLTYDELIAHGSGVMNIRK